MKALPARLTRHLAPALTAYALALALLAAAAFTGNTPLLAAATLAASAMLLFAACCGIAAVLIAARWRTHAPGDPKPERYFFCLANALAATLLLALGAVLAIACLFAFGMVHTFFSSV